jgi:hypothetical protein
MAGGKLSPRAAGSGYLTVDLPYTDLPHGRSAVRLARSAAVLSEWHDPHRSHRFDRSRALPPSRSSVMWSTNMRRSIRPQPGTSHRPRASSRTRSRTSNHLADTYSLSALFGGGFAVCSVATAMVGLSVRMITNLAAINRAGAVRCLPRRCLTHSFGAPQTSLDTSRVRSTRYRHDHVPGRC